LDFFINLPFLTFKKSEMVPLKNFLALLVPNESAISIGSTTCLHLFEFWVCFDSDLIEIKEFENG